MYKINDNISMGKIICEVLSGQISAECRGFINGLNNEEWHKIYYFALSYNLVSLLYSKLHKNNLLLNAPEEILYNLRDIYNQQVCIVMINNHEFKNILKILHDAGIEVILLKGIYLSEFYYDDPAERIMSDIDFLLKENDLDNALILLEQFGCKATKQFNKELTDKFSRHIPPLLTPKQTLLEVHWKLINDNKKYLYVKYDYDKIWETKVTVKYCNAECFALKKEYLLIHLCVHIAEDLFKQKLQQLYDVFLVIKKSEIDWELLFNTAKSWHCLKPLYSVLLTAGRIFYHELPEDFVKKIKTEVDCPEELIICIKNQIFSEIHEKYAEKAEVLLDRFENTCLIERIKYLYWTFFNREKMMFQYGYSKWSRKLYFIRSKDLIKRYFSIFLKLYLTDRKTKHQFNENLKNSSFAIENWLKLK